MPDLDEEELLYTRAINLNKAPENTLSSKSMNELIEKINNKTIKINKTLNFIKNEMKYIKTTNKKYIIVNIKEMKKIINILEGGKNERGKYLLESKTNFNP